MILTNNYYTNKVWKIKDLVKHISKFKHQFENASDIERLSNNNDYQHILYHIYNYRTDNGLVIRKNDERLVVNICLHKKPYITLTFKCYEKYKKIPYYFDITFLNTNEKAINNQRLIANRILNDDMLLEFFR